MDKKVINLRLSPEEYEIVQFLARSSKKKITELFRTAIMQYYFLGLDLPGKTNIEMIFDSEIQKLFFSNSSDAQLHECAQIAFNFGIQNNSIEQELNQTFFNPDHLEDFELQLHMQTHYVYAPTGQRWMTKVEYRKMGQQFIFAGRHVLGKNFSQFVKYLWELYATHYSYTIQKHELDEDRVILVFAPNGKT